MTATHLLLDKLIDPLRDMARALGYALAIHGSLKRDIDLVAVPWTKHAVDPVELSEYLTCTAAEHNDGVAYLHELEAADEWHRNGCPGMKPHGRLVWSIQLGGGVYIDLSVMPRKKEQAP